MGIDLAARSRALAPSAVDVFVRSVLPLVVVVCVAFAMQFSINPLFGDFYAKVISDIGIAIVLGVSLNFVNGFTGQFSIGQAGFILIGGYTSGLVTFYGGAKLFGSTAAHVGMFGPGEWLFVAGCLLGGLVAAGFGYLVGLPSLRLRGDYLAIVTLGFGEILRVLIQATNDVASKQAIIEQTPLWKLLPDVGGALGFNGLPYYTNLFWVYLTVGITLVFAYRLKESSHGRAFLSIREDEIAAEAMGIPTTRLKVRAFVIAAFFAGIAGGLFAHEVGTSLNPKELGFQKSFELVIMVVLGGMGSISGTVLAAIVLTILPELLRGFDQYRMITYALVLIFMMLVRPQGLFGLHEIWQLGRRKKRK
jgi:branched-chain amino acid transport system permease protein